MTKEYAMDRAKRKIEAIYHVTDWLIRHWDHIPNDLYKKKNNEFIPIDIRQELAELVRQDLANAIQPTVLWRAIAKEEGLNIEETELDQGGD